MWSGGLAKSDGKGDAEEKSTLVEGMRMSELD